MFGNDHLQKKKQDTTLLQSQRDLELLREDRQAHELFSQSGTFKTSSRRSTARNHRNHMIYRNMQPRQTQPYGKHQQAVEYISRRFVFLSSAQDQARPELLQPNSEEIPAEQQLHTQDTILHLCRSKLLEQELDEETLKGLTDHLTAGQMWTSGDNPNAESQKKLRQTGLAALQEIYFRHLEAMDKKYGENLIKMTPAQYLKALPGIEDDFAVLKDMRSFFAAYLPLQPEQADHKLMQKKLDFYSGVWDTLQQRERLLTTMDPESLTAKGELTKAAKNAHQDRMRALRDAARQDKTFANRREKPASPAALFAETARIKSRALEAMTEQQRFEESKEERLSVTRMARNATPNFTQENACAILEEITAQYEALGNFLTHASDEELLRRYSQTMRRLEFVSQRISKFSSEDSFVHEVDLALAAHTQGESALDESLLQRYQEISRAAAACTETQRRFPDIRRIADKRMQDIARYGCTQGKDLLETESSLHRADLVSEALKQAPQYPPKSFAESRKITVFPFTFHLSRSDSQIAQEIAQAKTNIAAIRKIREVKQQQPDYYRLGQSYESYLHCEKLLNILPLYEQAMSLFLRIHHLNEDGMAEQTEGRTLEQLKAQFKTVSNAFSTAANELNTVSLTPQELRCLPENDLLSTQIAEEEKEAFVRANLLDENMTEELLQQVKENQGLAFLELPAQGEQQLSPAALQTMRDDLTAVKAMTDYVEGRAPTPAEQLHAARLLERFSGQYEQLMQTLKDRNNFSDMALVEHRSRLEQCAFMGRLLYRTIANKSMSAFLEVPEHSPHFTQEDRERITSLMQNLPDLCALANYATALVLEQVETDSQGKLSSEKLLPNHDGTTREEISLPRLDTTETRISLQDKAQLREEAMYRRQRSEQAVGKLRSRSATLLARDQILYQQSLDRKIGLERKVSADDGTSNAVAEGWIMQAASWAMRDRRTMDHGESQYQACREKYLEYRSTIGPQSILEPWQRGSEDYAPPVELEKYFQSPLKREISGLMRPEHFAAADFRDFWDHEFQQAMEAIQSYCGVEGIVNLDTTAMEMAFLDTFHKRAAEYLEGSEGIDSEVIRSRRQLLTDIAEKLGANLSGTLKASLSDEEFDVINARTVAYIEDTTLRENLDESNVRDIPLFLHEPCVNDLRQSSIGDCWLLSCLTAVVKTSPDFVRSMFHDLGDGNVLVRLYVTADHPRYFKLRKHYETGFGNASACIWAQLLEKAYALSGFNQKQAMKVRGNRLYNVAAELTDGDISEGILHLTGRPPQSVEVEQKKGTASEVNISPVDVSVIGGMVAGMTGLLAEEIRGTLNTIRIHLAEKLNGESFSYDKLLQWIKDDWFILNQKGVIEKKGKTPTEEEKEAFFNMVWTIIQSNLEKMRLGIPVDAAEQETEEQTPEPEQLAAQRRHVIEFTERQMPYPWKTAEFLLQCRDCIREGGTIPIALGGHCLTVIDVKEPETADGKWFLLVRDPFNIYNMNYQKKGETVTSSSEEIGRVFLGQKNHRHLIGDREKILRNGFRGTSWWEAGDVFKQLKEYHLVTKPTLGL